jgi:uncharacterized protein DUF3485
MTHEQSPEPSSTSPTGARLPVMPLVFAGLVAVMLTVTGLAFRLAVGGSGPVVRTPPKVPLSKFSREFLGYEWTADQPLRPDVEKVLGAMAYVNRGGFRERDRSGAHLWISYFGESQTMVEHEPQVCMRTDGWSLPEGIGSNGVIALKRSLANGDTEVPVNVYVFRKDVTYQLLINTYCVNGKYLSDRNRARFHGGKGVGFYAQIRVVIPLDDYEWSQLRTTGGGISGVYELSADAARVARGLRELDNDRAAGSGQRRHPYLRAAEIMRHVVPELERHLPLESKRGAAQ